MKICPLLDSGIVQSMILHMFVPEKNDVRIEYDRLEW
jgi:hypothetical protein